MTTETTIAATWLYTMLHSDAMLLAGLPGGIWEDLAPRGTAYPFAVFHLEPGDDLVIIGAVRLLANLVATVKVVDDTDSYQGLEPLAARIDALLHKTSGQAAGGEVISCVRDLPVRYLEFDEESRQTYRHLGGQYSLQVQS